MKLSTLLIIPFSFGLVAAGTVPVPQHVTTITTTQAAWSRPEPVLISRNPPYAPSLSKRAQPESQGQPSHSPTTAQPAFSSPPTITWSRDFNTKAFKWLHRDQHAEFLKTSCTVLEQKGCMGATLHMVPSPNSPKQVLSPGGKSGTTYWHAELRDLDHKAPGPRKPEMFIVRPHVAVISVLPGQTPRASPPSRWDRAIKRLRRPFGCFC